MKSNNPLLSICIPTYNRSEILKNTIEKLLSLKEFDDDVELVISDNASLDNTQIIVQILKSKYKEKQIIYHRNKSNIKDLNFYTVLSLGTGRYLKLFNDYTYLNNEILYHIKTNIKENEHKELNLFFYDHLRINEIQIGQSIDVNSLNDFQKYVNNKITWISNFGCWKKDLEFIREYNQNYNSQLLQMEWTLHLVNNRILTKLVNVSYNCFPLKQGNRTPYNFFIPHVVNYYKILESYKRKGKIQHRIIRYDKRRILTDFVGNKIIEYLILKKSSDFTFKGSWKIIIKHFYNIPSFYSLLIIGVLKKIKHHLKNKINEK